MSLDFKAITTMVGGIVEVGKILNARLPKRASELGPGERVAAVRGHDAEMAALLQKLAEQLENVAAAGEALSRRVKVLLAVSIGALLISLAAVLLAILY